MVLLNILKNIELFNSLETQELDKIREISNIKKVKKKEYLFKKGDLRNDFFIILSGRIKLSQNEDKKEAGWAILAQNDFISACSLVFPSSKHQQTAFAIEDSELLVINGEEYKNLSKKNIYLDKVIMTGLTVGLNDRLKHSTNKLLALYQTGKITANEESIENVAKKTLKVILNIIKAQKGIFCIFNKYKKENIILAAEGFSDETKMLHKKIPLKDDKLMKKVLEGKKIYILNKTENEALSSIYKIEKALAVPLIFDDTVIGLILIGNKLYGDFSENNEMLIELIANQISGAIYRAERQSEIRADEELKRVYISH